MHVLRFPRTSPSHWTECDAFEAERRKEIRSTAPQDERKKSGYIYCKKRTNVSYALCKNTYITYVENEFICFCINSMFIYYVETDCICECSNAHARARATDDEMEGKSAKSAHMKPSFHMCDAMSQLNIAPNRVL